MATTAPNPRRILPTLHKRAAALASGSAQQQRLAAVRIPRRFDEALAGAGLFPLAATGLELLQINVGRKCNQTCRHCHVDAGPDRTEMMSKPVIEAVLALLRDARIPTLDITGGAPELHPQFREIVDRARALGVHVMHRCNLTAIRLPNYADIPAFLAEREVGIVASLPYYRAAETDAQRGDGVFGESIDGLRTLNALGYGTSDRLRLDLVTNPVGTFLPGDQKALEAHWKRELERRHGIVFDRLFTITNMPISRFLEFLEDRGRTEEYLTRLVNAFNPVAAAGVMCRTMLSVGYDGRLFDCDFNQMLDLGLEPGLPATIFEVDANALQTRPIAVGPHCFGCTAGAGSSCGGATA